MTVAIDLPVLLTAAETAKILRIPEASLAQDRFYRRGLPYLRIGSKIRYDRAVVAEYLAASVVPPGSAPD
jgi:hypothetical protein